MLLRVKLDGHPPTGYSENSSISFLLEPKIHVSLASSHLGDAPHFLRFLGSCLGEEMLERPGSGPFPCCQEIAMDNHGKCYTEGLLMVVHKTLTHQWG